MRQLDHLMGGAGWAIPKYLAMLLYHEVIEQLAGVGAAFTAGFEATHQDINALVAFTNHVLQDRVLQVGLAFSCCLCSSSSFLVGTLLYRR